MECTLNFHTLHIDTGKEWRGGQKQVLYLIEGMLKRGCPCTLACPKNSPLWKQAKQRSIPLLDIPSGFSTRGVWKIAQFTSDLVACHTSHAHTMGILQQKPCIVHRRVDFIPSSRWKYSRPSGYVAVSQAVADIVSRFGGKNISVVHDGVSSDKAIVSPTAAEDSSFDIIAVGALVAHKGHSILSAIAKDIHPFRIAVAGEGPLRYENLHYLGYRNDIPSLLSQAKVFVHPSLEEGMGQILVEAMLAKVPIVASNVGGIPEVIQHHGTLVPANDKEALIKSLVQVLHGEHPCLEKAYDYATSKFSIETMVDATLLSYQSILTSLNSN